MRAGVTYRFEDDVVRYEFALRAVGIEPVRISPFAARPPDSLDGIVLTGGTDVNPARYGAMRQSETEDPDDALDELEIGLLRDALSASLPVLAICRGLQLFNVFHGGTLKQHLNGHDSQGALHNIETVPNSRLAAIIGEGEHAVNSRHHQAVAQVGKGLVSARSSDGVIEALERPGPAFAVAVQWHPEDRIMVSDADRKLFQAFGSKGRVIAKCPEALDASHLP
jgi:putative glutamine amidotransferase